jgi:hypothetical protein
MRRAERPLLLHKPLGWEEKAAGVALPALGYHCSRANFDSGYEFVISYSPLHMELLSPSLAPWHYLGTSSSTSLSIASSLRMMSDRLVPSRRYTQSPWPPPSFAFWPSCSTTQSKRLGPEMGELSQICLLGGCLLST